MEAPQSSYEPQNSRVQWEKGRRDADEGCGAFTVHVPEKKDLRNFLKVKGEIKEEMENVLDFTEKIFPFFGQLQGENKCLIS